VSKEADQHRSPMDTEGANMCLVASVAVFPAWLVDMRDNTPVMNGLMVAGGCAVAVVVVAVPVGL